MSSLPLKNIRLISLCTSLIVSLGLSGCIYSGAYETGYFKTVVDMTELTPRPDGDGFRFDVDEFYETHGTSIVSADATANMEINYVETGDASKPAVIFVHGSPDDWLVFWRYLVISELKENAHLVSIDRPGWGDSTCKTPNGDDCFYPLLKQQSKYLDTLVKQLDQQNNHQGVILVGHSLGGPLIGQMALDYPEYVKGLVFISGPFDPRLSRPRWYNRFTQVFGWFMPSDLKKSNREMLPLSKQLRQMEDHWASIDAPIWVIQGSKDDLVNRKNLDFSKSLFSGKDAQFIEVEESGHFVVFEKQSVVVESIKQALNGLQPQLPDPAAN